MTENLEYPTQANTLPVNKVVDIRLYILDPLSTIIKLAILSNKPIGTKVCIMNNVVYLQEPGPFQSLCRYLYKTNKTDLQYLYNPIEFACQTYLTKDKLEKYPKLKDLFKSAQQGIQRLIETYKSCAIIGISLNYFYSLISNYLEETSFNPSLFRKDSLSPLYTQDLLTRLNRLWPEEKIRIVLNLTTFLSKDEHATSDVKSLETIMTNVDNQVKELAV